MYSKFACLQSAVDCKDQSLILISHSLWEHLCVGLWLFQFQTLQPIGSAKKVLTSLTLRRVTVEQTQMTRECSRLSKVNRTQPILFPYCGRFQFDIWNQWKRKPWVFLFFCLLYHYAAFEFLIPFSRNHYCSLLYFLNIRTEFTA